MPNRLNYRILVIIAFMQGMVFYGPVATIYRRAYGLDIQGLFLIESISWIVTIVLEGPWGRFTDRFGYRKTLLLGNLAFLASKIVFSFASGFPGFLVERLMLSVALAALSGSSEAMVYCSVGSSGSDKAFGHWHAASGAGLFGASLAAPFLYSRSLRMTAYWTIVPYAAALACSLFLVDVGEAGTPDRGGMAKERIPGGIRAAMRTLSRDGSLLMFLVAAAVVGEAAQAATVFLSPLQYERAGIPRAAFGILFAVIQGTGIVAAVSGLIARRLGRASAFRVFILLEAIALAALAITDNAFISVAALIMVAAASAMFRPLSATLQNERVVGRERATALSVNAMLVEIVSAVVNIGIGWAAAAGLRIGFAALSLGTLAFMALPHRAFEPIPDAPHP